MSGLYLISSLAPNTFEKGVCVRVRVRVRVREREIRLQTGKSYRVCRMFVCAPWED